MKRRLPRAGRKDVRADVRDTEELRADVRDAEEPRRDGRALDAEAVREALRGVIDPEVGLDIVTMGLVYDVAVEGNAVRVTFTLTTPGCPLAGVIRDAVEAAVAGVSGVQAVEAELVWEPGWNPGMIEEGAW